MTHMAMCRNSSYKTSGKLQLWGYVICSKSQHKKYDNVQTIDIGCSQVRMIDAMSKDPEYVGCPFQIASTLGSVNC